MKERRKAGAPLGGRVHWFLHSLDPIIKRRYQVSFDYSEHAYALHRKTQFKFKAVLIVVRTSRNCFRLTYHNFITHKSIYKSFTSAKKAADWFNIFGAREIKDEAAQSEREALLKNFPRALRRLFRETRRSQWELANFLNVRQQTISKYVNGEYLPTEATVEKIANFFEVGYDYFLY